MVDYLFASYLFFSLKILMVSFFVNAMMLDIGVQDGRVCKLELCTGLVLAARPDPHVAIQNPTQPDPQ